MSQAVYGVRWLEMAIKLVESMVDYGWRIRRLAGATSAGRNPPESGTEAELDNCMSAYHAMFHQAHISQVQPDLT